MIRRSMAYSHLGSISIFFYPILLYPIQLTSKMPSQPATLPVFAILSNSGIPFKHWSLFIDAPQKTDRTICTVLGKPGNYQFETMNANPHDHPSIIHGAVYIGEAKLPDCPDPKNKANNKSKNKDQGKGKDKSGGVGSSSRNNDDNGKKSKLLLDIERHCLEEPVPKTPPSFSAPCSTTNCPICTHTYKIDAPPTTRAGPNSDVSKLVSTIGKIARRVPVRNDLVWWNSQNFVFDLLAALGKKGIIDREDENSVLREKRLMRLRDGLNVVDNMDDTYHTN